MRKRYFLLFCFFLLVFFACGEQEKPFTPAEYFPVSTSNYWEFNGILAKMEVMDVRTESGIRIATFAFRDTLGMPIWKENYHLNNGQIYWATFEPGISLLPDITFDPPIPVGPFSNKLGDVNVVITNEIQSDTLRRMASLDVIYEIVAVEDIVVPAGTFFDCIKLKITYQYTSSTNRPLFIGEHYWWYAPGVGPVKYDIPAARGELVRYSVESKNERSPDNDLFP